MSEYFYPLDGRKHYKDLMEAQKDMFQAFIQFNNEVFEKPSSLPKKVKELIAVAVAHTTQCPYCIEGHVKAAKKEGATDQEIAESIFGGCLRPEGLPIPRFHGVIKGTEKSNFWRQARTRGKVSLPVLLNLAALVTASAISGNVLQFHERRTVSSKVGIL
jgi:AhpD family alkylhydroperoxidase